MCHNSIDDCINANKMPHDPNLTLLLFHHYYIDFQRITLRSIGLYLFSDEIVLLWFLKRTFFAIESLEIEKPGFCSATGGIAFQIFRSSE